MKIIIIANGFTGTTLPLANMLSKKGHKVKCMYIVKRETSSIESLDFVKPIKITAGNVVPLSKKNDLYRYLNKDVDISLMPIWKRKRRMEKFILGKIFPIMNLFLMRKYIQQIIAEKPDVVNLVVHTIYEVKIANALKEANIPFTITYHEVLTNLVNSKQLKDVVSQTMNLGCPIVCHSQKTAKDLIEASGDKNIKSLTHVINFGAFESYISYGNGKVPSNISDKYLLYIGHIFPYKGLRYLYEAVQILGNVLGNTKILVAGRGKDPVLNKMKSDKRFIIINHFIDNAELVGLIRNCEAMVCPYIAASQSGLVQTGMVFNKPIVATKVGAFTEVVENEVNGLLCEPADAKSLAEALCRILNNEVSFENYEIPEHLRWDTITEKYLSLYNDMIYGHK